jgi:hypothetical protein
MYSPASTRSWSSLYSLEAHSTENTASNISCVVQSASVAAETSLQSHFLAMSGFLRCCSLAMDVSSRSTILAFSHRVTLLYD